MGLQKNVAGQKWFVFAFDRTDNTPKTGDAGAITAKIGKDFAAAGATNDVNPTEIEDGFYAFDLTQAETNADVLNLLPESGTSNIQVIGVPGVIFTNPVNFADTALTATGAIGLDWGNIENKATANDLSATDIQLVDTATVNTDMRGTDSAALATALATAQLDLDTITDADGVILGAAGVDLVWDEILTGATHNINTSSGKRLRQIAAAFILHAGTAQAGSNNTITLDTGASSIDDFYNHARVIITENTGIAQERIIVDYVGSTRIAKIAPPWITNPASGSEFEVEPGLSHAETNSRTVKVGIAQAGTSSTITLDTTASSVTDFYVNDVVMIDSGTGEGQERIITAYNESTKVATVEPDWITDPDSTSEYIIEEALVVADVFAISNDMVAADNLEAILDGTGAALEVTTLTVATNAMAWNAAWDAEIQSEVDDALIAKGLDHLVFTSVAGSDVADDSVMAQLVSKSATADWDDFINTTDSLQAIRDKQTDIETDTAQIGTAGAGLTDLGGMSTGMKAEVNVEVVDVIRVDTATELSAVPAASPNLHSMIQLVFMALRNKIDVTATAKEIHDDAGVVIGTKTLSDDATTYSETKAV